VGKPQSSVDRKRIRIVPNTGHAFRVFTAKLGDLASGRVTITTESCGNGAMTLLHMKFSGYMGHATIHCVPKNATRLYISNNSAKNEPILIIYGVQAPE